MSKNERSIDDSNHSLFSVVPDINLTPSVASLDLSQSKSSTARNRTSSHEKNEGTFNPVPQSAPGINSTI